MKTGSFFTTKGLAGRVSIARFAPKGFRELPRYGALAPGPWFKSVTEADYRVRYAALLAELDPAAVRAALHGLAGGAEPLLLCWERPGRFCHRRLLAAWFEEALGESVEEHGGALQGELFGPPAGAR